ncbi:MAG: hypothetical protein ACT4PE_15475, partial [Candidatus Eiseniibacteriota bacterium]
MRPAVTIFPILAALWLAPRLVPGESPLPRSVLAEIEGLSVSPSPETGRPEIRGLPDADGEGPSVFQLPAARAARTRFEAEVLRSNERLARAAEGNAGHIELFPEEGVTAVRVSGLVVPFYEQDAERLARARATARDRPYEALESVAAVLDARLAEAPDPFGLEESTRRRDMTRLSREIRDELAAAEAAQELALARFREDLRAAAGDVEGPFRRRGALRIVEIALAALLGATLREAVRRETPAVAPALVLSFAPVLAVAAVLLGESLSVLPVDALGGTHVAFVPLSFLLGFSAAGTLEVASRLDRREAVPVQQAPRETARAVVPERAAMAPAP